MVFLFFQLILSRRLGFFVIIREMKVLIIGGGGREHALGWKLNQSSKVSKLFFCPGNAGTAEIGENIGLSWSNTKALVDFALNNKIDLVVVGVDDALAFGITDVLKQAGIRVFGPDKYAAQIESSKSFAKAMMKRLNIPTADSKVFNDYEPAKAYIKTQNFPVVIKASGLARGKGVIICKTHNEAILALQDIMLNKRFGEAGNTVIIEEFLEGYELSVHAISDGKSAIIFPISQDNKAIYDGDRGPNTGGMGTVAPLDILTKTDMEFIRTRIVQPIIDEFRRLNHPYIGCLYPGLMITKQGIRVIEYNARFGDPECQSYMRLLESDLFSVLMACVERKLSQQTLKWSSKAVVCVVLASKGYPTKSLRSTDIKGLDQIKSNNIVVFHAATKKDQHRLLTDGGRVLNITSIGPNIAEARKLAYKYIKTIKFSGMQFRTDIGLPKTSMNSVNKR